MLRKEFNFVTGKMVIHESTKDMAYMVLVKEISTSETAKAFSVTRQAVYKAVRKVRIKHLELTGLPDTWKQVSMPCSPSLAKKIKEMQENEVFSLVGRIRS